MSATGRDDVSDLGRSVPRAGDTAPIRMAAGRAPVEQDGGWSPSLRGDQRLADQRPGDQRLAPMAPPGRTATAEVAAPPPAGGIAGGTRSPGRAPKRVIRRAVTVRKLDPWPILKLSVIFYLFALLVLMLVLTALWALVTRLGYIDALTGFLNELQVELEIDAGNIAKAVFYVGLLGVVLLSGVNVFVCFLYNLVADLVGGLRMTLAEHE